MDNQTWFEGYPPRSGGLPSAKMRQVSRSHSLLMTTESLSGVHQYPIVKKINLLAIISMALYNGQL